MTQCDAFDVLHDREVAAIRSRKVQDGGKGGVMQFGKRTRFVQETAMPTVARNGSGNKQSDRDFAVEVGILVAVDKTHTTAADSLENAVVAELEREPRILKRGLVRPWEWPALTALHPS